MLSKSFQFLEKRFFETLNKYLEPLIRAGIGSPGLSPVGAVVLETKGRKTGRTYQTPVLASRFTDLLLVSSVRSRSQWMKNLAASPQTKVWLQGQPLPVMAYVVGPGLSHSELLPAPSPLVQFLLTRLRSLSKLTGANFVILDQSAVQA